MWVHAQTARPTRPALRLASGSTTGLRMPPGFFILIAAQAISSLADNALLIVAIALLQERGFAGWWAPLLKFGFTLSYVVLAPLVGPLGDAVPKGRLMIWMNGVKMFGVVLLIIGVHPVVAFAVIGFGAAAYAPAKYGLVTEIVPPLRLVAANGWLEVSVVCAVLLGTVLGGFLVTDLVRASAPSLSVQAGLAQFDPGWSNSLTLSSVLLLGAYALSGVLNLRVPDSGRRYPPCRLDAAELLRDFSVSNRALWRDRDGGLSLAVTTIFWGVGATLQFAVLRWAVDVMQLTLDQAAYLQAAVAVGVVAGAALAGRLVSLGQAKRMLPAGVALGLLMPLVASAGSLVIAIPLLALVGVVGGLLVVPLNALLQHRGQTLLSAGRSIAVQGFNENLSILIMLAGYTALTAADTPIVPLLWGFGLSIAAAIAVLIRRARSGPAPGPGLVRPEET